MYHSDLFIGFVNRLVGFSVEGICYGISAGTLTITMLSGACSSDFTTGSGYVGHRSNSWLFIQEVDTDAETGRHDMITLIGSIPQSCTNNMALIKSHS